MSLREKLRERVQPLLEPGENVQSVFLAQQGPSPYWGFLSSLVFFLQKYYVVAVTDRRIAFFRSGAWTPAKPRGLDKTFPRETRFGDPHGLWQKLELGGERFWVHTRFHKDLQAADGAAGAAA